MRVYGYLLGVLGFMLCLPLASNAQLDSEHAIGGRFGSSQGITYRHTLAPDRAIEGILGVQSNSSANRFRLMGLYEYHKPLNVSIEGFSWFYGFGGSIGSYRAKAFNRVESNGSEVRVEPGTELLLSIDGIIGVEYQIPEVPLSVSLDVKPYFDFVQESSLRLIDPIGFSIRYKF